MWAILGVVVLLVAGGVTAYFLVFRDSGGAAGGGPGGGARGDCTGDYCVGRYPYANACGVFPPSNVAARLGDVGGAGVRVGETYADPLPPSTGERPPTWTYGLRSRCDVTPVDGEGAAFRTATVELVQYGNRDADRPAGGDPLAGFDGARVEHEAGGAVVRWARGNVEARLDVSWTTRKPDIPDATLATAAKAVDDALATPPGPRADLGEESSGGKRVVDDACEVFTGEDFQQATKYTVSPLSVVRTYRTGDGPQETSCTRTTASRNNGIDAAEGTTILDGAMSPAVRISEQADPAAAASRFAEEREAVEAQQDLPGVGDAAVFGIRGDRFTLLFTSGVHLVQIDCGLSNGNADWTPADMRQRLEPLAKAIAGRMP
ncbi:hypothetical protein [Actinokineospora bangkokensis]|uniref:Uncharacterized protein n=1 Tax=Actinokineospora bangkokensis TaxID=1193682 RepID=A0A1Q9LM37_9PSEU|nr:hypothetical protein [Actinokineospora bangkokensis]OLR93081.1 hypothetical protein BJP25_19225 [Actinokineospora bangkokensis]